MFSHPYSPLKVSECIVSTVVTLLVIDLTLAWSSQMPTDPAKNSETCSMNLLFNTNKKDKIMFCLLYSNQLWRVCYLCLSSVQMLGVFIYRDCVLGCVVIQSLQGDQVLFQ